MNQMSQKQCHKAKGSAIVYTMFAIIISTIMGMSLLSLSYSVRAQSAKIKNETASLFAAEAAYEQAVFWMTRQADLLTTLKSYPNGIKNPIPISAFSGSSSDYTISFHDFFYARPVFKIEAVGHAGPVDKMLEAYVVQAVSGWDGTHQVPSSANTTVAWPFSGGEVINTPLHINKINDSPDVKDIRIYGRPTFAKRVEFGESKGNKYTASDLALFKGGVSFNQPDNKINDKAALESRVNRFIMNIEQFGNPVDFIITPVKSTAAKGLTEPAVQIEFYVEGGVGKMRITNNCTVQVSLTSPDETIPTYDYKVDPTGDGSTYVKYPVYCYHYAANGNTGTVYDISSTYVTQEIDGIKSTPGGQIFVNGNVILGSDKSVDMFVKGKISIMATGNIWIGNPIKVDGPRDADGMPTKDNPNILGLISQGVIKVIDPVLASYNPVTRTDQVGPEEISGLTYRPVAIHESDTGWNMLQKAGYAIAGFSINDGYYAESVPGGGGGGGGDDDDDGVDDDGDGEGHESEPLFMRILPGVVTVEAAITVGGGGWGAENVGDRYTDSLYYDTLVVRGSIVEVVRGIVGSAPPLWRRGHYNGFTKRYYFDERLLQGILPGDVWLQSKYVPVPAGWHDYRLSKKK